MGSQVKMGTGFEALNQLTRLIKKLKTCSTLYSNNRRDPAIIQSLFLTFEVDKIIQIPLVSQDSHDEIKWLAAQKCHYSVKSWYNTVRD
jgi:hypothetical protein